MNSIASALHPERLPVRDARLSLFQLEVSLCQLRVSYASQTDARSFLSDR
jgi:hypothetical protein